MNFRVVPIHPDLILGIPILHRFNPLINWQERSFRVHRQDGTHWTPIVKRRPCRTAASVAFPHDTTPVTATGGIPFPEWKEPTEDDKCAVAKMYDAATEDTRFSKSPMATAGGNVKRGRKKKKKGQRPETVAPKHSVEVLAPEMETLLTTFADVFHAALPKGLHPLRHTDHRIVLLPNTMPPRHCLYRIPITQKAERKRQIDELLAAGHIEMAQLPFGAWVLFVEKHVKTLRLCVDHRHLNAISVKEVYHTPRVDVSIDKMKGARFFAKMDLRSGFYQIRVATKDVH